MRRQFSDVRLGRRHHKVGRANTGAAPMTTPVDLSDVDDLDLTSRARAGDERAVVELWTRHFPAALATARRVARQPRDAEELASDAFSGMLAALSSGGGPTGSVRAYLLTSVRNGAMTRARRSSASDVLTDEEAVLEQVADVPLDPVAAAGELGLMREAFATLPKRWQHVLWRTAVDHESNMSVADELGLTPNAVAALAHRARQGLRAAYVQAHVSRGVVDAECVPYIGGLASMLTPSRASTQTARHVDGCARCTERLSELRRVDQNLSGVLGPAVLTLAPGGLGSVLGAAGSGADGGSAGGSAASGSTHWVALAAAAAVGAGLLAWALWPEDEVAPRIDVISQTPSRTTAPPTVTSTSSGPTTTVPATTTSARPKPPTSASTVVVPPPTTAPSSPSPTPTATTTTQPQGRLSAAVAMGGPESAPFIQVSGQGQQIAGGLGLSVTVPAGVTLVASAGDWVGCTQSGTVITCSAPAAADQQWSGSLSTSWQAGAAGTVTARLTGTYASGRTASASASTTWPP